MPDSTETREKIIAATFRLVSESEGDRDLPTMAEIAAASGVSRQAVYLHFENRARLFTETARSYDRSSGFLGRIAATRELEPVPALDAYIRAWFAYIPEIVKMARALLAAEAAGQDGGEAWRDRMGALRWGVELAVQRICDAGALAEGWDVDSAADWVWARIHFTAWYHLAVERGWTGEEIAGRVTRSVISEVCV